MEWSVFSKFPEVGLIFLTGMGFIHYNSVFFTRFHYIFYDLYGNIDPEKLRSLHNKISITSSQSGQVSSKSGQVSSNSSQSGQVYSHSGQVSSKSDQVSSNNSQSGQLAATAAKVVKVSSNNNNESGQVSNTAAMQLYHILYYANMSSC